MREHEEGEVGNPREPVPGKDSDSPPGSYARNKKDFCSFGPSREEVILRLEQNPDVIWLDGVTIVDRSPDGK